MRSIFGWSYPPGCHRLPWDEDYPCEVCAQDVDDCICPECPECGCQGDPSCYLEHGLRRSEEQKFLNEIAKRQWEDDARAEHEYWKQVAKEGDENEFPY